MTTTKKQQPITLNPEATPGAKVLIKEDDGLILMEIADAVASCSMGHRMLGSIREEQNHIAEYITAWYHRNSHLMRACQATFSNGKVLVLCTPKGEEYDFELGDRMADLNMDLTKAYRLFAFDSLQLPEAGYDAFVEIESDKAKDAQRT